MRKKFKWFLAFVAMVASINMWGTESYLLDFTKKSSSSSNYTNTWTWTVGSLEYSITNAANSNGDWAYVKFGGKGGSNASDTKTSYSSIESPAFEKAIESITMTSNNASSSISNFTLNSIVLTVTNGDNTEIDKVTKTSLSNSIVFTPTAGNKWAANCSYKITINWKIKGKNNIGLQVEKVEYAQAEAEPIDVTLSRNGSTTKISGQTAPYTLPAVAAEEDACDGWEFKGWSNGEVSSTTSAPTFVTQATATGTYYAVYGKTEGGAVVTFAPGTTTSGSFTISSGANYASGTGSKIDAVAASNADSYLFTQISDNQYSIKLGDNYITYSSSTNLGTSTTPYSWTILEGINGDWRVASGTSERALIYRAGTTNQFGGYSTNNVTANSTEYYDVSIGGGSGSTTTYTTSPDCGAATDPKINASNVDLAYSATSGEIAYTIENATEATLSASSEAAWISNIQVAADKVTFDCTANTTQEARIATIKLSYEGATDKNVTITQAAAPYSTIADLFNDAPATAADVNIAFGNWVISGIGTDNKSVYVTDNAGKGFVIYGSNHGFAVGDVLSGTATCKFQLYTDGFLELTNLTSSTSGLTVTKNGTVTPQTIAIADLGGINTGAVITFSNILYNGTEFTDGTNVIKPYNKLLSSLPSLTSGKKYNATGVYIQYGAIKEIAPRTSDDIQLVTYNITINDADNGTVTSSPANKACEGDEVILTITPNAGYRLSSLSVTDADGNPVEVTENKFTMPAGNVTVSAVFAEIQKRDVTLHIGNGTTVISQVADDTKFFDMDGVPTPKDEDAGSCANKFMGWATSPIVNGPTDAAGFEAIKVTSSTVIDADHTNFYAVFATAEEVGEPSYKITTTLTKGKTYIFDAVKAAANATLANNTAFGAVAFEQTYNNSSPNWGAKVDLTPDANGVIATNATGLTDACKWTLESITDGNYAFKKGEKYLYLGTSAGSTSGAQCGLNTDACCYLENVSSTCKDAFLLHPSSSTNVMLYNTSNGYRMYAPRTYSATMTPYVRFYEYDPGTTYSNYITSCKHTVTAAVNDGEMGTLTMWDAETEGTQLTSGADFAEGTEIWFRKEANEGYEFLNWSVTEGAGFDEATGKLIVGSMDVTVTANFRLIPDVTYDITIEQPTGATISASKTADLAENEEVTLSYELETGYKFNDWTITGAEVTVVDNKFNMPAANITVSANISKIPEYSIVWKANGATVTGGSKKVLEGNHVAELPEEPETCDESIAFMGWTNDLIATPQDEAPEVLFTNAASAPVLSGLEDGTEVTYYAVYAEDNSQSKDVNDVWDLTSTNTDWTKTNCTDYFSQPYGMKKANAYIINKSIKNLEDYASKASKIKIGVKCLQNGGTDSKLTITLVDADGNAVGTGKVITPTNATVASSTEYAYVEFDAAAATGYKIECTTFVKNILINGVTDTVFYTQLDYSAYSTTCEEPLTEAPSISPETGTFCSSVDNITLTDNNGLDNVNLYYRVDDAEEWTPYNSESKPAISTIGEHTLYAKAIRGTKESPVAEIAYTVLKSYNDLGEALNDAGTDAQIGCFTFSDLLINGKSMNKLFAEDADGNVYTFSYKGTCGIARGDKIEATDAHLTFSKVNGVLNFASVDDVTTTSQNNPTKPSEATAITAIKAGGYYAHVVKLANVTMHVVDATAKSYTLIDENSNEIAIANTFIPTLPVWLENAKYDVYGIIVLDSEGNPMIAPRNSKGANEDGDMISLAEKLATPEDLVVSDITSCGASFAWGEVTNASKYSVYIYDKDEKEVAKSENRTTCTYAPTTKFDANSNYTWKVKAIGDNISYTESDYAQGTFTTNPNAKLNWYVGGSLYQTTNANQEKVVTPEDPESPCATNYENFVTWYNEEIDGQNTALVAANKVKAGDAAASQAGSAKEYNFYAVFGKIKTQGTDKYVAVTEAITDKDGNEDWRGEFLIGLKEENTETLVVFDGHRPYMDGTTNEPIDDSYNSQSVTLQEEGTVVLATEDINSYRFIFTKSTTEGKYNIQTASGYYIGGKSGDKANSVESSTTTKYDNEISWDATYNEGIEIYCNRYLCYNADNSQKRFRYMGSDAGNIILYKREKTNPQYSGYITTCPVTYTITIANNAKGLVEAATTTEILKGAKVQLTATAYDGYTKTGGNWIVKNTTTGDVVENLVGNTNYLTMPDYDVTVDYDFQEIKDNFVDNLHGNTAIEKGGANYELPTLVNAEPGEKCDAYYVFAGWVAAEHTADSGEPAEDDSHVLNGKQTATGATYYALWWNVGDYFITECCTTPIPEKRDDLTKVQATSAQIGWYKVDGADKYHVTLVKDGDTKGEGEDLVITDGQYKYVMNGLTVNTSYTVYVKAHISCWGEEQVWNFTTAEEKNSYKVTINAEGGTYTIDPVLVDGKITEGETVTITDIIPNDADHYFFKELTVPEATDLIEIEGSYMFTMPSKAITINIVFAEYPKVTWKMEGQADVVTSSVRQDNKFVVGTVQSAPENWKYKNHFTEFAGWMTNDDVENPEFVTTTTEVPADGLTVYGAVAKSAKEQYQLLTDATTLVADDKLIIVADNNSNYYAAGDIPSGQKYLLAETVPAPVKSVITITNEAIDKFTLGGVKDAWTLHCDKGYLKTSKTKENTWSETADTWKISIDDYGTHLQSASISGDEFYFNYNNGNTPRFKNYTSKQSQISIYRFIGNAYSNLTINPQPDYGRTDLVVGNYGTVCVPYAVKTTDRSGATFWSIETSNMPGYTNPTSVTIVQETEDLKAGKPYIFCAEGTTMSLFFSGDKYESTTSVAANGLYGNLTEETIIINEMEYTPGYFFVLQQKLYECGVNCTVRPNRGWIQANQINVVPAPLTAPRRVIGNPNVAPTRIDNLSDEGWVEMTGAHKYFRNGTIIIVNEGKLYNAQGQIVK